MNSKVISQSGRGSGRGLSPGTHKGETLAEVMKMISEGKHSIPAFLSPGQCFIPGNSSGFLNAPALGAQGALASLAKGYKRDFYPLFYLTFIIIYVLE